MERYDGKTRKADYIKYTLITTTVLAVVIGLSVLCHVLKKANQTEPDFTVVIGSEEAFNDSMLQQMEALFASLVEDRNGDGEVYVRVEALRLTDFAAAKQAEREAMEAYQMALETDGSASLQENFSGLTAEDDFSRLLMHLYTGDCCLYLLSDQKRGDFQGAATVYCQGEYFIELPEDLQDSDWPSRMELTDAPFLQELGLEDIPFYGCVLDGGSSRERELAIDILRSLRFATAPLW